jgi:hypothetical protein
MQWVKTNQSIFRIYATEIVASWYYADSDVDVKYRCLRMLDWLVFTHPWFGQYYETFYGCNL